MKSIRNFQYCFTVFVLFLVILDSTSGQGFYKKKKSKWGKFGKFAGGIAALGLGAFLGNKYQQNGGFGGFGGFGGGGGSPYGGQYGGGDYGGGGGYGGYGGQGGGEYYKK